MQAHDTTWVLISTGLVLLMTPGLAFFYGGLVRERHAINTIKMSILPLGIVVPLWALLGFSLAFGPGSPWLGGLAHVGLAGVGLEPGAGQTIPELLFMAFQMTFAVITPALIAGAVVGRMRFRAWIVFVALWSLVVYVPLARWVWGPGGWLAGLGALDFAGGTVVHISSGVSALVAARILGPRMAAPPTTKTEEQPHSIPFVILGAALLWFGWIGFNAGSSLAADGIAVLAAVNTILAGAVAMLAWVVLDLAFKRRASAVNASIGIVVGLIAVTPAAGFVTPLSAIAIGFLTAPVSYGVVAWLRRTELDDTLDVFACHGVGGIVGAVLTGVFATAAINPAGADGLVAGNPGLVLAQAAGVLVAMVLSVAGTASILLALRADDRHPHDGESRARGTRPGRARREGLLARDRVLPRRLGRGWAMKRASNGSSARPRADAGRDGAARRLDVLFDLLRDTQEPEVSIATLRCVLSEVGLRPSDPRLVQTREKLRALETEGRGDIRMDRVRFEEVLRGSASLLERAIRRELAVPDFTSFARGVEGIFESSRAAAGGEVASYIPQLSRVDPELYGLGLCTVDGQRLALGDAAELFCVQSSCKPVTYCLALEDAGAEKVHEHVGFEPSGRSFNELSLNHEGRPHNPMINAGAIMACSLIGPHLDPADRFDHVTASWARMAGGRRPGFANAVYLSERRSADRNFALGYFMRENGAFPQRTDLRETLEFYFQCCSLETNADDFAVVAATLANGGVCPLTEERVLDRDVVRKCLTLMSSCGMYDFSGEWAFTVGLPAKSGVSGVIVVVIPGKMGLCAWSPRLDRIGNSVRGVAFCRELASRMRSGQLAVGTSPDRTSRPSPARCSGATALGGEQGRPARHPPRGPFAASRWAPPTTTAARRCTSRPPKAGSRPCATCSCRASRSSRATAGEGPRSTTLAGRDATRSSS